MDEYKKSIQIEADDPICSASGLQGTVIGILFEKTGQEIQEAIDKRIGVIDTEISRYDEVTGEVRDFLKKKEEEIKKIEKIYVDRKDEKEAKAKPFQREIKETQKKWDDQAFTFDKETEKNVATEAVGFEKGFEKYENIFNDIDKMVEEEGEQYQIRGLSMKSAGSYSGDSFLMNAADNNTHSFTSTSLVINETEDKALAKLNTLKDLVRDYTNKIRKILSSVNDLKEEQRRLDLICKNLDPLNKYKLDLNKLSAFGFENIAVS